MELTKETFDDFISRLKYHHRGEGVNDHCTRDPIFIVQSRKRVYGFDPQIIEGLLTGKIVFQG